MDKAKAEKLVTEIIGQIIGESIDLNGSTSLVGNGAILDSMQLVEVCLALEDLADENGFEFDWTSGVAMSKSRGMFRNINALSTEFSKQSEA